MNDLPRHLLEKYFGEDPRLVAAFEEQAAAVEEVSGTAQSVVAATNAIRDAVVVLLSGNSEFTNERILKVSDDITLEITGTDVRLKVKNCARTQDFSVMIVPTGDTVVGIPDSGDLISSRKVTTLGNFASDAAASAGGVPVGGLYRNGSVLMVRVA